MGHCRKRAEQAVVMRLGWVKFHAGLARSPSDCAPIDLRCVAGIASRNLGFGVQSWPLRLERAFGFDLEFLKKKFPKTKKDPCRNFDWLGAATHRGVIGGLSGILVAIMRQSRLRSIAWWRWIGLGAAGNGAKMNDFNHLDALRIRLSRARGYLAASKPGKDRAWRQSQLIYVEKEIEGEIAFLAKRGIIEAELPAMTDDELLAALIAGS